MRRFALIYGFGASLSRKRPVMKTASRILSIIAGNADVGEDVDGSDFLYCSLFHGSSWHSATGAKNLRAGYINGLSVPLVAIGEIHLLRAP